MIENGLNNTCKHSKTSNNKNKKEILRLQQKLQQILKSTLTHYPKLFQPSLAFHIETFHLICTTNQMTGININCNTWLKQVNKKHSPNEGRKVRIARKTVLLQYLFHKTGKKQKLNLPEYLF